MKITRLLPCVALCVSIGVPATLAVSEDCRKSAFDLLWKAKVRAMQAWDNDPKHRAYVERHKLKTADHSRATAALRARMLKALDLACGVDTLGERGFGAAGGAVPVALIPAEGYAAMFALSQPEVIPSELRGEIPKKDLPSYPSPGRDVNDGMPVAAGSGGWMGFGLRPPVETASIVPMVATPEPAAILLVGTGICLLAFLVWVRLGGKMPAVEEDDDLGRAYVLGDHLKRFDGSQWDMAIETYQQALKHLKDCGRMDVQAENGPSSSSRSA